MNLLFTFALLLATVAVVSCRHHGHHGHPHHSHDSNDHDSDDYDDEGGERGCIDHFDHGHHGHAPEGTMLPPDDPCHANCATWCGTHEHAEDDFHAFHNVSSSACHCPDDCYCEFDFDGDDGQMHYHDHHVTLSISHYSGSAHAEFCESE